MTVPSTQVYPVIWQEPHVLMINQTRLPREFSYLEVRRCDDLVEAIRTNVVRGDAIGVAAAYGLYLGTLETKTTDRQEFLEHLASVADRLRQANPDSMSLRDSTQKMLSKAEQSVGYPESLRITLLETAKRINAAAIQTCYTIGSNGFAALPESPERLRILTHGNAGALSTAGYGTALGIVRSAWQQDRLEGLYVTETRPRFHGSRLTAWECVQEEIPVTVIADGAAALCMQQGKIDVVIVGADRVAANGDVINRIGTYSVALAAKAHQIPFLVALPTTCIDFNIPSGLDTVVPERDTADLTIFNGVPLCPKNALAYNPAVDVTPAELITKIVTEQGAFAPQDLNQLQKDSTLQT